MTKKEFEKQLRTLHDELDKRERQLENVEQKIKNAKYKIAQLQREYCQGEHDFECVYSDYYSDFYKCKNCGIEK